MATWLWILLGTLPWVGALIYYLAISHREGRTAADDARDAAFAHKRDESARIDLAVAQDRARRASLAAQVAIPVATLGQLAMVEAAVEGCSIAAHAAAASARVLGHDGDVQSHEDEAQAQAALAALRIRLGLPGVAEAPVME